jgi:extracellular matrix regulatory protein A
MTKLPQIVLDATQSVYFRGKMEQRLLNIGFGNTIVAERIVAIITPNTAPIKRIKDEAKAERRLVDATHGRKTRAVIIIDSNHVILSAIQAETLAQRVTALGASESVE